MTKQAKPDIIYYPASDLMWNYEVSKLLPWLDGKGADIGCGRRSINKDVIRVDIDAKKNPDVVASGEDLPFKDNELDFVYGIHAFEHLKDPVQGLKEWLRVVKPGGIVGIVHPDIDWTKKQNPEVDNPGLKSDPYNKHWHEYNQADFVKMLSRVNRGRFEIIDSGVAMGMWSFYVILRKK